MNHPLSANRLRNAKLWAYNEEKDTPFKVWETILAALEAVAHDPIQKMFDEVAPDTVKVIAIPDASDRQAIDQKLATIQGTIIDHPAYDETLTKVLHLVEEVRYELSALQDKSTDVLNNQFDVVRTELYNLLVKWKHDSRISSYQIASYIYDNWEVIRVALSVSSPQEGWVTMPKKLTQDMINNVWDSTCDYSQEFLQCIYDGFVAAAPPTKEQ